VKTCNNHYNQPEEYFVRLIQRHNSYQSVVLGGCYYCDIYLSGSQRSIWTYNPFDISSLVTFYGICKQLKD
jgi:hypothetical protein